MAPSDLCYLLDTHGSELGLTSLTVEAKSVGPYNKNTIL